MGSDAIYRQDTIDAINTWDKFGIDERSRVVRWHEGLEPYVKLRDVVWAIEKLPSAEPERKTGKWIGTEYAGYADGNPVYYEWKCSACGCVIEDDEPTWNFCPNCGADMRGEQNED